MKMKRNQKILALLLVFMLFVSMLSACAGRASTPQTRGYLDSDGKTHIISSDDTDDEEVYDGPDDSEDGLAPAVPGFTGTETAELIAPYHALAIEYNGYIYYLDDETNLCRADTNMQNYELVLARPLGDKSDGAYICGVTNAGMIYIGSTKGSCYLDANSADLWPLTTTTFSGAENQVQIRGISGEWMYYTKDRDTDKYLYRCKLGGAFYTEEQVFDFAIWDAALTEDYIVLVCGDGKLRTLGYQSLDDLQRGGKNEIDSGYGNWPGLNLVAVQNGLVVYELRGMMFTDGTKLRTINLDDGTAHSGTNSMVFCGYDAENDELVYFEKRLAYRPVQEIEADTSYGNSKGYKTSEYLTSHSGATIAGDWFFFKADSGSGGADYFIDLDGMTLNSLD